MMSPGGMMGWGHGSGLFGMIAMTVFGIAVIIGIVLLVLWLVRSGGGRIQGGNDSALTVLKARYARGEIGKKDFEEKKKDLSEK